MDEISEELFTKFKSFHTNQEEAQSDNSEEEAGDDSQEDEEHQ